MSQLSLRGDSLSFDSAGLSHQLVAAINASGLALVFVLPVQHNVAIADSVGFSAAHNVEVQHVCVAAGLEANTSLLFESPIFCKLLVPRPLELLEFSWRKNFIFVLHDDRRRQHTTR